jgi:hypothetical protein
MAKAYRVTKAERVLRFIRDAGLEGRSFTDIQSFIMAMNGLIPPGTKRPYSSRGYWCDYLTSGGMYSRRPGILNKFCIRHPTTGRWILTERIQGPFTCGPKTKTEDMNHALARGRHEVYLDSLPSCPNCKGHVYTDRMDDAWSPDKVACTKVHWSSGALLDCMGRLWFEGKMTGVSEDSFKKARSLVGELFSGQWDVQDQKLAEWLRFQTKLAERASL